MTEFDLEARLRELGEPSPLLQLGPLPEAKTYLMVIEDLVIANEIIARVGYARLPNVIAILNDRLETMDKVARES